MSLRGQTEHISTRSATWLYNINVFLGFLPPKQHYPSKRAVFHIVVVIVLSTLLFIVTLLQGTNEKGYGSQLATHVVLTHLSYIFMYVSLLVACIHGRVLNSAAILSLMTDITSMDRTFGTGLVPGWKFTVKTVVSIILTIFYVVQEEIERHSFHLFPSARKLFIGCSVILALQIYSFGIMFQQRFRAINTLLLKKMVRKEHINVEKFHNEKEEGMEGVYDMFLTLVNAVREFNRIFGWQILFLCGTFVLSILHVINLTIVVLNFHDWDEIDAHFWIMFVSYLLTTLVLCIPFASSCNDAAEEAKRTSALAYTLLSRRHEKFGYVAEHQKALELLAGVPWPGFSAAGFFDVDHTMLFTLFGSVTSYLIVLIQLKDMAI